MQTGVRVVEAQGSTRLRLGIGVAIRLAASIVEVEIEKRIGSVGAKHCGLVSQGLELGKRQRALLGKKASRRGRLWLGISVINKVMRRLWCLRKDKMPRVSPLSRSNLLRPAGTWRKMTVLYDCELGTLFAPSPILLRMDA